MRQVKRMRKILKADMRMENITKRRSFKESQWYLLRCCDVHTIPHPITYLSTTGRNIRHTPALTKCKIPISDPFDFGTVKIVGIAMLPQSSIADSFDKETWAKSPARTL